MTPSFVLRCIQMKHESCHEHHTYKWVMSRTWLLHTCCDACNETSVLSYDTFHWKCITPKTHRIEKPRFLGISRYKFKLRPWLHLNLYRRICLDLVDLESVAFSVETLIRGITVLTNEKCHTWHTRTRTRTLSLSHIHTRTHTYATHSYLSWCGAFQRNTTAFVRDMTHSYYFWISWI